MCYQIYRIASLVHNVIVALGSVALDTTRTPARTVSGILGGSGTYFSLSASFFYPTGLVSVVGSDFPGRYTRILAERVDLDGSEKSLKITGTVNIPLILSYYYGTADHDKNRLPVVQVVIVRNS